MAVSYKSQPAAPTDATPAGAGATAPPAAHVPGRGPASGPEAIAASALAAPATKLPYFDQIQRAFGRHSIANVRARIGDAATGAAQQLGARGFAFGEDIVLRDNADLHTVAHEAAHVIQQRGRATFAGLGAAGDEHEQHAELVAERVARGESAEQLLDQYAPGAEVTTPRAVQLFAGERPFHDYGAITKHSGWLLEADAYEKRLGVYAYSHGVASAALDRALDRMTAVLMENFKVDAADRNAKRALFREAFTKDDPSSAGQIGTDARLKTIMEMLRTGNLRERMTAFYNAAYYNNAGKDKAATPARGFKEIAKAILFDDDDDRAHDLGLDETKLAKLAEFNHGWWRWGAQWLTSGLDLLGKNVSYNFADDPFALGNLALAQEVKGTGEIGNSQNGRTARTPEEKAARGKTAKQYADLGMPLSKRELAYVKASTPAFKADPKRSKLPWVPGHAYWQMPDTSHWIASVRDQLHMPIIAGVSGTTTRMLSAFQWLDTGVDALHFRLALIGWMLPVGDHSLYEILRGAQLAGVAHGDEGDLTDVVRMYMNVAPLSKDELRAHAGKNGMFPHEHLYQQRATAGKDTPGGFLGVDATNRHGNVPANANFTQAHATAIYAYTSGVHMIMNAILETKNMPRMAAHRLVRNKLLAVVDYQARVRFLRGKAAAAGPLSPPEQAELTELTKHPVETIEVVASQLPSWLAVLGDHTKSASELAAYRASTVVPWITERLPRIYDELLAHTNMTVEGLKVLPAAPSQVVWRGDWQNAFWGASIGSKVPINVLRSFSKKRSTAEGFMSDGKFSTKVLLRVQTKDGGAGRDIKALSKFQGEDEILMMPGTVLVVTNVEQQPGYTLLHCDEQ